MRPIHLALALSAFCASLFGDTVYLKNGTVLDGRILYERDRDLALQLQLGGIVTIPKIRIEEVRRTRGGDEAAVVWKPGSPLPAQEATGKKASQGIPRPFPVRDAALGCSVVIPAGFVAWRDGTAPPQTRRYREAATGATICVTDAKVSLLDPKRERPLWATPEMAGPAFCRELAQKVVEVGGRPGARMDLIMHFAGRRFREVWVFAATGDRRNVALMCSCPEDLYGRYRDTFERTIQSFRVEEGAGAPKTKDAQGRTARAISPELLRRLARMGRPTAPPGSGGSSSPAPPPARPSAPSRVAPAPR